MSGHRPEQDSDGVARRTVLRTAGVGVIAGIGAAFIGGSDEAEADAPEPAAKSQYRETDHVRRVYDLSRF